MCNDSRMARTYQLRKRAERQEETRRRIVEAAIDLHGTIGPARTSVSAIADRAGVQRHTYYRHFPDDRSLFMACSGLYMERNPLPDPEPWHEIRDPDERLRQGSELYEYYEANEPMISNVMRDAELDPVMGEVTELRIGPGIDGYPRGACVCCSEARAGAHRPRAPVHNVALTDTRQRPHS